MDPLLGGREENSESGDRNHAFGGTKGRHLVSGSSVVGADL